MKKIVSYMAAATMLASSLIVPITAFGQVQATMPYFYNQSGQVVNNGNTSALPAGYYYLQANQPSSQIYYYGNGTYFNPATGEYGGSAVNNPNGVGGVNLGYNTSPTSVPSVPNTGAGGNAATTWIVLALSAVAVIAGAVYFVTNRKTDTVTSAHLS